MGQRHQLYLVAKIARRYRPLAALHNQWLYSASAVARCSRLLQVFQAPENRIPVQQELLAAQSRNEAFWDRKLTYDYRGSDCAEIIAPFPFISTLFTLGSSFDPIRGIHDRVLPLQFNTPFDGGDNNDGVTIIDVTRQDHPRYCFVFFEGRDYMDASQSRPEMYTPLSASDYLKVYDNECGPGISEQFRGLLESMKQWPLMDIATLAQTWPHGRWGNVSDKSGSVGLIGPKVLDT